MQLSSFAAPATARSGRAAKGRARVSCAGVRAREREGTTPEELAAERRRQILVAA